MQLARLPLQERIDHKARFEKNLSGMGTRGIKAI